jgi:O-antigen/teichoic acid export membrane protein
MIIRENIRTTLLVAYITSFLAQVCELGFNFLVFKQFSVENVGTYGLIMSIVTFFNFALDMGLNQTLFRGFSQGRIRLAEAIRGSAAMRIPVAVLGIILLLVWVYHSPTLAQEWLALCLAILTAILWTQRTLATSWLRAHDRQTLANIIAVLLPLGKLAGGILLIKLNQFHLVYFFGAICLVEGLVTTLAYKCTGRVKLERIKAQSLSFDLFKESARLLWKPGMVFFLIGLCTVLQNRLDWMLVYAYVSKTELAYYSLANKFYELFNAYIGTATITLFPWLCRTVQITENNPMLVLGTKALAFVSVLLAGLAALYAPTILKFLWGNKYEPANTMIFLFMCGATMAPFCAITYNYLVACGHERYILVTGIAGTLAQTGANFILIPKFGGLGATLGMIILLITAFIISIIFSLKISTLPFFGQQRIIIHSVLMMLILFLIKWQINHNIFQLIILLVANIFIGIAVLLTKDDFALCYQKWQLAKIRLRRLK